MKKTLVLTVNGERHELAIAPDATLLRVLREDLGLRGAKRGCDTSACGCCTVHVNGKAVYACAVYAMSPVRPMSPVNATFIRAGAVQCGFCTCGMIMSARQLLAEVPHPDEEQIRHAIAGNLCRCTGYAKIVDAIKMAAGS